MIRSSTVSSLTGTAIAALLALNIGQSAAQARPDVRAMSCQQAQGLVIQRGAVVMTTGRYTYHRFVSGRRYCDRWQDVRPAYSAAADGAQCQVGWECFTRYPSGTRDMWVR